MYPNHRLPRHRSQASVDVFCASVASVIMGLVGVAYWVAVVAGVG